MTTKYLSIAETAARLGVSQATVARWVRSGRLTKFRLGGRVLFSANEVESLTNPLPDGSCA